MSIRRIQIYDTTLRDGSQGEGVNFSLLDKLQIAQRLDEIGVDFVEGGYPLSNAKDAEFFVEARKLRLRNAQLCAFGMTRRRGLKASADPGMKALLDAETPIITIVGKTWDFHVTEVLGVSLAENLDMVAETISYLCSKGRRVIYDAEHFFDGWNANPSYAAQTIQAAAKAGAEIVVLCDTNGGTMPHRIAEVTSGSIAALSKTKSFVGIHCHNDCDLSIANSLAAIDAGACHVQGTINGIGERCGNADLVSIIANLGLKRQGFEVLNDKGLQRLTELSRFVYDTANMPFRNNQPFVGASAFAHKGGMHVHAVAKSSRTYEHIQPELIGNERRVLLSELSGRSNVLALASSGKLPSPDLSTEPQLTEQILRQVVEMENQGYQFEAALGSFELLAGRCAGSFTPNFELLKYHVTVECDHDASGKTITEATVKVRIDADIRHEVAEGDGPVNALDAALRKALIPTFPNLEAMRLVDYRVRVVNSEAGTAARIRVVIESTDGRETWGTVGVSENIIEASWLALHDAIEFKLLLDLHSPPSNSET
jgi:2-isopropylmalate synthase